MTAALRLQHPAGAAMVAAPDPDGHWRLRFEDRDGLAFALAAPPYFQHAERAGDAVLLVGEHGGTHYSAAATVAGPLLQVEFAERWGDRAAGRKLELRIAHWRTGAPISMGVDCDPPWELAPDGFRCQHPPSARRAEYRLEFRAE